MDQTHHQLLHPGPRCGFWRYFFFFLPPPSFFFFFSFFGALGFAASSNSCLSTSPPISSRSSWSSRFEMVVNGRSEDQRSCARIGIIIQKVSTTIPLQLKDGLVPHDVHALVRSPVALLFKFLCGLWAQRRLLIWEQRPSHAKSGHRCRNATGPARR